MATKIGNIFPTTPGGGGATGPTGPTGPAGPSSTRYWEFDSSTDIVNTPAGKFRTDTGDFTGTAWVFSITDADGSTGLSYPAVLEHFTGGGKARLTVSQQDHAQSWWMTAGGGLVNPPTAPTIQYWGAEGSPTNAAPPAIGTRLSYVVDEIGAKPTLVNSGGLTFGYYTNGGSSAVWLDDQDATTEIFIGANGETNTRDVTPWINLIATGTHLLINSLSDFRKARFFKITNDGTTTSGVTTFTLDDLITNQNTPHLDENEVLSLTIVPGRPTP
jgi:hypothetical protein